MNKILEGALQDKLSLEDFPYLQRREKQDNGRVNGPRKPGDVIVFVIGGITYAEVCLVNQINKSVGTQRKILIGGTTIHNSKRYVGVCFFIGI